MLAFRYLGRTKGVETCDDCECRTILRSYETASGYLYLCPECGHQMEDDYRLEAELVRQKVHKGRKENDDD